MEMLRAEHISKAFDSRSVLRDVTVRLEEGELVSILGLSGSGKTTLLNIISGLISPDGGQVTPAGRAGSAICSRRISSWNTKPCSTT